MKRLALLPALSLILGACENAPTQPPLQSPPEAPQFAVNGLGGYAATDLGTLGGAVSSAIGINDVGQVVGFSLTASGDTRAFLWDENTTPKMTDLGALSGDDQSTAWDINEAGQVVGRSSLKGTQGMRAFLWDNGVMTPLGFLPGHDGSTAWDINDVGQIAGYSYGGGVSEAFRWEGGVFTPLGTLGGASSWGKGINNAGQVVGYSQTTSGAVHGFLWDENATPKMTDLGTLPGHIGSDAYRINAVGQVVGQSNATYTTPYAVLWENGVILDLGNFGGTQFSVAEGINDAGQVVGGSEIVTGGESHAFVWDSRAGMIDLGMLGGTRWSHALGINELGQIVGESDTDAGNIHATLWEPRTVETGPGDNDGDGVYCQKARSVTTPQGGTRTIVVNKDDVDGTCPKGFELKTQT